jgi:hypothetical protein
MIYPLTADDFLNDVLFSETIVRMIMHERGSTYDEARETWNASKEYGMWRYPLK